MKKIASLILIFVMLLFAFTSCSDEPDNTTVKVGVLNGTTGVGIAKLYSDIQTDNAKNYEITIYSDVSMITADLAAGNLDIAALPTTNAAVYSNSESYNSTQPIQIVAVNTLSVLYMVSSDSTVSDFDSLKSLSENKTIYLPGKEGDTPDVIFRALLKKTNVPMDKITLAYSGTPADLPALVKKETAKIAVLPEPMATAVGAKTAKETTITRIADIGEEWGEESPIAQGCIVARKNFIEEHKERFDAFMADYADSVSYIANPGNVDSAASIIGSIQDLNLKEAIAKKALKNCNIVCLTGDDMKTTLKAFYAAVYDISEASVGGKLPSDDFYYVK